MPQQINLFHPVLLAPKHHFPALAMVQALGLWSLALVALAGFSLWRSSALQAEMAGAETRFNVERAQLGQALAARQATAGDPAALAARIATNPRDFDARFALAALQVYGGDFNAAFDNLLEVVLRDKAEGRPDREKARKQLIEWFTACPDAEAVSRGRRYLGMYLN